MNQLLKHTKSLLSRIFDLMLPRYCIMCDTMLAEGERWVCPTCMLQIHPLRINDYGNNLVLRRFWDKLDVQKGYSLMHYDKGELSHNIFVAMKYHGRADVCLHMGMATAEHPFSDGFFSDIDYLIPIPLSRWRKWKRGYNQAEFIARGISKVSGIPIMNNLLYRKKNNTTQTHQRNADARFKNVAGIFSVRHPERLAGKHILVIDDIITTGATMLSALTTINDAVPSCKLSVMSVGLTQNDVF